MLPIVLVLLVATSALAAPSVLINQVPIQETSVPYDTGVGFNGGLASRVIELYDGGNTSIYILTLLQTITDLANQKDSWSQALAISQLLAVLGQIGYGRPGNSCAAANAINSGNGAAYLSSLAGAVDAIAALSSNPDSIRYSSSPAGSCQGNGYSYQFESAWTQILAAASPYNLPLVNEAYCATSRLRSSYNALNNNVAAAVTAASSPAVVQVVQRHSGPIVNFLRAAANGNGYSLAGAAKQALRQ